MIEKLCKDLKTSYDTNILDNESDIVQQEFLNVSLKNRTNSGRKVLMELICNHYDKSVQKPIAEFIGGPFTLSIHWHPGFKKMIYIFGELHSNITDCDKFEKDANTILIEDYLYNLMLTTDVFLDIYLENFSYQNGEYNKSKEYVPGRSNELFKKFKKCIQYNTRSDTSCKLARVHYFDIRDNDTESDYYNMEENKINILWFFSFLFEQKVYAPTFVKYVLERHPKVIRLLKELVQDDITKVCEFMKKQLEENPYIKKELNKINNPQLKPIILNFYGKLLCKQLTKNIPYIKKDILNILNYKEISDNEKILNSITSIKLFLTLPFAHFADVYLIARVFKDFDMEKKKDKSYFDQPKSAHNIIIYGGDFHSESYRDFLSSIGFHEIDNTGDINKNYFDYDYAQLSEDKVSNKPKNCLDMRKIKQPFFSYSSEGKEVIKKSLKPAVSPNPPKTPPPKTPPPPQFTPPPPKTPPSPQFKTPPQFTPQFTPPPPKTPLSPQFTPQFTPPPPKTPPSPQFTPQFTPPQPKTPLSVPLPPKIEDEVPEEPCPAIHATPQPPLCWDKKTKLQYHPDKNRGCPKTATELFKTYGNLKIPTDLKECEEKQQRKQRKREQREKEKNKEKN